MKGYYLDSANTLQPISPVQEEKKAEQIASDVLLLLSLALWLACLFAAYHQGLFFFTLGFSLFAVVMAYYVSGSWSCFIKSKIQKKRAKEKQDWESQVRITNKDLTRE